MAADNMTGCLPDVWQFCEATSTGINTNLVCPSVAYRRPVQAMSNKLYQVGCTNLHALLVVLAFGRIPVLRVVVCI